jgi:hypothetical protein
MFTSPRTSAGGGGHARGLLESSRTIDVIDDFKTKADRLFGDGHFVEAIVFTPEFECLPEDGQSHATLLRYVATTQDDVFPICEPYAPALARVEEFSRTLLETEYSFVLDAGEDVESVEVTDGDGVVRELDPADYSYDPDAGQFEIDPVALTPFDASLTVQVARRCGQAR